MIASNSIDPKPEFFCVFIHGLDRFWRFPERMRIFEDLTKAAVLPLSAVFWLRKTIKIIDGPAPDRGQLNL